MYVYTHRNLKTINEGDEVEEREPTTVLLVM